MYNGFKRYRERFMIRWNSETPKYYNKIGNISIIIASTLTTAMLGVSAAGIQSYLPMWMIQGSAVTIFLCGIIKVFCQTRTKNFKDESKF